MKLKIRITFLSDYMISSGLGDGFAADSMLVRDSNGIIYIPGRAVKGALREGASFLNKLGRSDLKSASLYFFGSKDVEDENKGSNVQGHMSVSSANLPDDIYSALINMGSNRAEVVSDLTCQRIQTALENSQVKPHSLRTLECGIRGTEFESSVDLYCPEALNEFAKDYMKAVCAAVKSIGGGRSRGFGSCLVSVIDDSDKTEIKIPSILSEEQERLLNENH